MDNMERKPTPSGKSCGILFCFNEEHILGVTLKHYLRQGIDLVVFDNYSTDASLDIIQSFHKSPEKFPGKIVDLIRIKTDGYQWQEILRNACDYMHQNLKEYEWIMLIDADALYDSPVDGMNLLDFLNAAKKSGYNIINGRTYHFFPTEKDDPSILSATERMHYCSPEDNLELLVKHHKIFRYHPTVDFHSTQGHIVRRNRPKPLNKIPFIYRHYPWVSFAHGIKKIFHERKPRYCERKNNPTWHRQRIGLLPIETDLVKDSATLLDFRSGRPSISRNKFFWIMELGVLSDLAYTVTYVSKILSPLFRSFMDPRHPKHIFRVIKSVLNAFPYGTRRRKFRLFLQELQKLSTKSILHRGHSIGEKLKHAALSFDSLIFQEPVAYEYPDFYHFLMANHCNARCIFCNQNTNGHLHKELTFENFTRILKHIPIESAKAFHFSGGGEPLLCKDIFRAIKYVNDLFPWIDVHIRTNGLLIAQYAEKLSAINRLSLEISLHGPPEENDALIQTPQTGNIFMGISLLNQKPNKSRRKLSFCATLTRKNIEQLPELIKKAAELQAEEVSTIFCRFYPDFEKKSRNGLQAQDSLYYHQDLYNQIIVDAKTLAKKLGVNLEHEPLFQKKFNTKPCRQAWKLMIIDTCGTIYPCTGGEVWFEDAVRQHRYDFGNLLNQHVYQFWNNDSYVMLRRTCSATYHEPFVPECTFCQNTICFHGADEKRGHFLEKQPQSTMPAFKFQ